MKQGTHPADSQCLPPPYVRHQEPNRRAPLPLCSLKTKKEFNIRGVTDNRQARERWEATRQTRMYANEERI